MTTRKQPAQNVGIKIQKQTKHKIVFLRAPNRYKKAQIAICRIQYKVRFTLVQTYTLIPETRKQVLRHVGNLWLSSQSMLVVVNHLFSYFAFFESTLFSLKYKRITLQFLLEPKTNLYRLTNYKK